MSNWIPAWRYSQGINSPRRKNPSLFVIHYAAMQSYKGLINYFHNNPDRRYADSTWCVSQKGEWCAMVKMGDTPWTNGSYLGKWVDEYGNLTPLINDIAFTVETSNDLKNGFFVYTEAHYATLAYLFKWTLEQFSYTHVTRVCSHQELCPDLKVDVGPLFDWERFLVGHVGMKQDIYDKYMRYLEISASIKGANCWQGISAIEANKKRELVLGAAMKIHKDLSGRPSSYYMK